MRLTLPLLLFAALTASAQQPLPIQQASTLGSELFTASASTGMVLVVVRANPDGTAQTFFQGYGETAPGNHQLPTESSILRLCSLTKIFTTDLLTKLAADQTVTLQDPLQHFAPAHTFVPTHLGHAITLEDLATHTSGLAREVGRAPHGTPHFTFPDYNYRWHWLRTQHLKTTPGTAALYSNVAFDLLGDALAHAANEPYATLLYQRTTSPLGMHETGYTPNPAQCARLLQGAHDEGPCTDTQSTTGSSGLYSTSADITLFLRYLLHLNPTPQDPSAQATVIDPANLVSQSGLDHAGSPTGIGLGWMHILTGPSEIIEKTGGGAGFTTYIALNQSTHTALFAAFTDGPTYNHVNVFKFANNLLLILSGLPPLPPEPPPAPHPTHKRTRHRTKAH
ncbi:MAG: D-alanyl-D-alanine-carboxypeptidase/endopeptidase AmpH [Acidobacteriota bacterium]